MTVWPQGLWGRFALCLVMAVLPLLALLFAALSADGRRVVRSAEWQAMQAARFGAEQEQAALQRTASVLRFAAQLPVLQTPGPACDAALARLRAGLPDVAGLVIAYGTGTVQCASAPGLSAADADPALLQQASKLPAGADYALGEPVSGRDAGEPRLRIAVPMPMSGVLSAALTLDRLAALTHELDAADDASVELINGRTGAIVAHFPGERRLAGLVLPDDPLVGAARAQPGGGLVEAPDLDGQLRISAFAPISGGRDLLVAIGLSSATVHRKAEQRLLLAFALGVGVAAVAVGLAWRLAQRSVLQPLQALSAAAVQLGAGKASADDVLKSAPREVRALAGVVARLGKRLQLRDRRIETMQRELEESERDHRLLAETANDMLSRFSAEMRRVYVSPACRELLGYGPEELVGRSPASIVHPDDWQELDNSLNKPLLSGQSTARATYRAIRKDGRQIWLESSGRSLGHGQGFVVVTRDVTERKLLEEQLAAANGQLNLLARQDALTGLANRRGFDEALEAEHRRMARSGGPMSVIMLDVDWFKLFNDAHGHPAGDRCLQTVAGIIEAALFRAADLASRYGGEEFAILLPGVGLDGALAVATRIQDGLMAARVPHAGSANGLLTVSIGVATSTGISHLEPAALIAQADAALYRAKREGRDRICLAEEDQTQGEVL